MPPIITGIFAWFKTMEAATAVGKLELIVVINTAPGFFPLL
jgi:hypothetical protein